MPTDPNSYVINPERMLSDFAGLSQIGSSGDGGVHRPALTAADLQARAWFADRAREAGLAYRMDAAGNQTARLDCGPAGAPSFLVGSHLDSVPYGGRFDGALGVTAALEVLRVIRERGISLPVNLEAVNFTDEEGTLMGLMGSRAMTGTLSEDALAHPKSGRAVLEERFQAAGLDLARVMDAARPAGSVSGYLELHIEQGQRLEQAKLPIGIVSGVTGICGYRLSFHGRADHSGTMPLPDRLDAGLGAAGFLLAAREQVLRDFPGCVVNVGKMEFAPGAFNIVPKTVVAALEFRSPDARVLVDMEMSLLKTARTQANRYNLLLSSEHLWTDEPVQMAPQAQSALAAAADSLGLAHIPLASFAGHDAQAMASICPAGMVFVPSVDGSSHSAREFTRDEDMINGANVLLRAVLGMSENVL
jgi:N-carbamoyl-L-amino-acid hydrolase